MLRTVYIRGLDRSLFQLALVLSGIGAACAPLRAQSAGGVGVSCPGPSRTPSEVASCSYALATGKVADTVRIRVSDGRGGAVGGARVGFQASAGQLFPATGVTDSTGATATVWTGSVSPDTAYPIAVLIERPDRAAVSTVIHRIGKAKPDPDTLGIELAAPKNNLRGFTSQYLPEMVHVRVTGLRPPTTPSFDSSFVRACEAQKIVFRTLSSGATSDTVAARWMRDGLRSECVARTRWKLSDAPGTQILQAELVGGATQATSRAGIVSRYAEVRAIAHAPAHISVGLSVLTGKPHVRMAGRDSVADKLQPIVGVDFPVVRILAYHGNSVLDRIRLLTATSIQKPLQGDTYLGLLIAPLFAGANGGAAPIQIEVGARIGRTGTSHSTNTGFVSATYDASGFLTNVLGFIGLAK